MGQNIIAWDIYPAEAEAVVEGIQEDRLGSRWVSRSKDGNTNRAAAAAMNIMAAVITP